MDSLDKSLKQTKARWYIKNRKRLLERQKELYIRKKRKTAMKKIEQKIILTFD